MEVTPLPAQPSPTRAHELGTQSLECHRSLQHSMPAHPRSTPPTLRLLSRLLNRSSGHSALPKGNQTTPTLSTPSHSPIPNPECQDIDPRLSRRPRSLAQNPPWPNSSAAAACCCPSLASVPLSIGAELAVAIPEWTSCCWGSTARQAASCRGGAASWGLP